MSDRLDDTDRHILNRLQAGIPITPTPFADVAAELGLVEANLIGRLEAMTADGLLNRFGPLYDATRLGGATTLAAMAVPADRFEDVAAIVNAHDEVAHNYARDHALNMWFVVTSDSPERVAAVLAEIGAATGLAVLDMPKLDEYFLNLRLAA